MTACAHAAMQAAVAAPPTSTSFKVVGRSYYLIEGSHRLVRLIRGQQGQDGADYFTNPGEPDNCCCADDGIDEHLEQPTSNEPSVYRPRRAPRVSRVSSTFADLRLG